MSLKRLFLLAGFLLTACASTPAPAPQEEAPPSSQTPPADSPRIDYPDPDTENPGVIIEAQPLENPAPAPAITAPPPPVSDPPEEPVVETLTGFERLSYWDDSDHRPALSAFRKSCESWAKAEPDAPLNPNLPEYGYYKDWAPACEAIKTTPNTPEFAKAFFENNFQPVNLQSAAQKPGLLTGYYEPEIDVRLIADARFFEPILAQPKDKAARSLARKDIDALTSRVIAYGRPADVFFMQVQGSGRIKYKDGKSVRAAYGGNNGKPYKSIGRVLIARGEMTKEEASKQSIERWMEDSGPRATQELMNQNPRYIFFTEQTILPGEGPRGAMRVPLTAKGSMAIDPRYHPYGTLAWLETRLPENGDDYKAKPSGILLAMQDTGSAIKGPLRGDVYFGAGYEAGEVAGVMKHKASWTILLPKGIAPKPGDVS